MTDQELLTLCAFQEADNQCDEGVAAVVRVALNRTRLHYASDGSVAGTILRHAQFSWTEYTMVNRVYQRVAFDLAAEMSRVDQLLSVDEKAVAQWARCSRVTAAVVARSFRGPLYDRLTDKTVLYDNLALTRPYWVASSRLIVVIGAHSFFEPATPPSMVAANVNTPLDPIAATKAAVGEA